MDVLVADDMGDGVEVSDAVLIAPDAALVLLSKEILGVGTIVLLTGNGA